MTSSSSYPQVDILKDLMPLDTIERSSLDRSEADASEERTLLVSVQLYTLPDIDADEFALLAKSAGAYVVQHLNVNRTRPDSKFFMGSGKVEELATQVAEQSIALVIIDHDLTPSQERNLEKALQCRVIDRTGLILDIFASRARTYEGRLQVELAQLQHLSSRLVRGFGNLEQQKGGIGLRGPGETQLETDRRLIRVRITQLKDKIAKVRQTRQQGRVARQKAALPTVALVGYTNAGKSTLFNRLTHSDVYAADQLFATLDPTLRRVDWDGIGGVILADTVGFIKDLRHSLIDSFRATLEETTQADLLLHVIDQSNPDAQAQIDAVEQVLFDIGADVPILKVYNKIDMTHELPKVIRDNMNCPDKVYISAQHNQGMVELQQAIVERLMGRSQRFSLHLDPTLGKLYNHLRQLNVITHEQYDDQGWLCLEIVLPVQKLAKLLGQHHLSAQQLLTSTSYDTFRHALPELDQAAW